MNFGHFGGKQNYCVAICLQRVSSITMHFDQNRIFSPQYSLAKLLWKTVSSNSNAGKIPASEPEKTTLLFTSLQYVEISHAPYQRIRFFFLNIE
jgi:hypothetical protein